MNHRLSLLGLAATLVLLSGCAKTGTATTGADPAASFDAYVTAVARKAQSELSADERRQLFNQYLSMQIAADAAEKAGMEKKKDVATELHLVRMNVLSGALLKAYLEEHPNTDAELSAEYDRLVAGAPMEYQARHILVADKATAESIIAQLKGGADFAKLAKKMSKDPSAGNGGDLGWFSLQSMVQPFAVAVSALKEKTFTEVPVQSEFGWHVIKLEATRKATLPSLAEVKDRLQNVVQRNKLQAHLDELRKVAGIDADKAYGELLKAQKAAEDTSKAELAAAGAEKTRLESELAKTNGNKTP